MPFSGVESESCPSLEGNMDKYDLLSDMAAQGGIQSKNDLDHVTRRVELPLIASSPTEFLQRCGRLCDADRWTDGQRREILY